MVQWIQQQLKSLLEGIHWLVQQWDTCLCRDENQFQGFYSIAQKNSWMGFGWTTPVVCAVQIGRNIKSHRYFVLSKANHNSLNQTALLSKKATSIVTTKLHLWWGNRTFYD
jgi:hypothetical protein